MLDFRLGSRIEGKNLPIPRKRNFHRLSIPILRKSSVKPEVKLVSAHSEDEEKDAQQDDDLPYVFTANKLPMHKQMFYQLCDLHVAEIQELISANDGQVGCYGNNVVPFHNIWLTCPNSAKFYTNLIVRRLAWTKQATVVK